MDSTVVFAWGAGEDGQLGLASAPDAVDCDEWHVTQPTPVPALASLALRADGGTALVGGSRQSLAVAADGGLFTWGWNQKHTLGLGHQGGVKEPQRVRGLDGVRVAQVGAARGGRAWGLTPGSAGVLGRLARPGGERGGRGLRLVRPGGARTTLRLLTRPAGAATRTCSPASPGRTRPRRARPRGGRRRCPARSACWGRCACCRWQRAGCTPSPS